MKAHHEFELFHTRITEVQARKLKVQKSMTYADLYRFIAKNLVLILYIMNIKSLCFFQNLKEDQFRLWDFQEPENAREIHRFLSENSRPRYFLDPNEVLEDFEATIVRCDRMIYIEMSNSRIGGTSEFPAYDKKRTFLYYRLELSFFSDDILAFIKFFNPNRQITEYKGTLILNIATEILSHVSAINRLIGQPADTKLNLYQV